MFQTTIDKESIDKLPVRTFEGEIVLVENFTNFMQSISELSHERVLGFDTETKPSFKRGKTNKVALLQLATVHKVFLFRINKIGLPDELKRILASPEIKKIGAATHDDVKGLRKIADFAPAGFIDLQHMAKEIQIQNFSLRNLTAIVLNFKISKGQRLTNWEETRLSHPQMVYAATDAWVSLEIYNKMLRQSETLKQAKTELRKNGLQ